MRHAAPTTRSFALGALVAAALAVASQPAAASCFYVYGAKNNLLYRSTTPPIDLSKPISQGIRSRFAGGHLTMIPDESGCPDLAPYGPTDGSQVARTAGTSPLDASPLFRNIESRSEIGNDAPAASSRSGAPSSGARR